MALKTHYSSQQNLNPGPGNYNIRRDLGRVSYSFGLKGPGMELGTKGSPGPGAYSVKTSFANIPGSRIGTGKRDDEFQRARRVGSPGPGAYTISRALHHSAVRLDAPRFGFGTQSRNKHSQSSSNLSPGPG